MNVDSAEEYDFDGYRLLLDWTGRTDSLGKCIMEYQFITPQGEILFQGNDFCASPMHSCDGIESAKSLLGFLTLQPGDTDEEYFENYTPQQMEFAQSFECENLKLYTLED